MGSKTSVGTTIMRVVADKDLPGSIRTGVTKALLKESDLVDYMLEELVTGIGMKAQRMYDYAKSGAYVHGLPSGQFTTGADGLDQVIAALESIEGRSVVIDYSRYGAPNNLHIGWLALMSSHGYNPATNQLAGLTTAKGTPVYLEDMVVVIPASMVGKIEPTALALWGLAPQAGYTPERLTTNAAARALIKPTPVRMEEPGTVEYLLVEYGWMVGMVYTKASFTIPIAGYDDNADYFHVRYKVGSEVKYWIYRDGEGTFPALDAVYDREPEPNGSYFPFAYFRYQKRSENSDKNTPAYKTSKKLVGYLGMNYDQVADGINANPTIGDVEQAMLMMAVPANTTHPLERRYLWTFFNNLFLASAPGTAFSSQTAAEINSTLTNVGGLTWDLATPTPGKVIQDTRFKMSIENDGIYKRRVAGSIGPVGTYDSGFTVVSRLVNVQVAVLVNQDFVLESRTIDDPIKYHYYRRQVSTGFYDEIQVVRMRTRFYIIDGYTTVGDELGSILIIPLDHSITKHFSVPDRETIYARSLHYVFNSVVITHIKWYQTGIFQVIMIIVAIVVAYFTAGASLEALYLALVFESYTAAAILILTLVVEYLAVQYAFKLFVKAVGVEAAFIFAIVATVVSAGMSINAGSINGAPWASELLQVSTGLTNAIPGQLKNDFQDLLAQGQEFSLFQEAQNKLIDDAKALLQNNTHLDPFVIFGESPQDFYNRTVHSGNIGVVGIGAISSYVDMALTLPKLKDTIGDAI